MGGKHNWNSFAGYKQRWYVPEHAAYLRPLYNNNFKKYIAAYRRDPVNMALVHEEAMKFFIRVEKSFSRQARQRPHILAGTAALEAFMTAVASEEAQHGGHADIVFACLDIEGHLDTKYTPKTFSPISGFGVTKLDAGAVLAPTQDSRFDNLELHSSNFQLSKRRNNGFIFGEPQFIEEPQLSESIINDIATYDLGDNKNCKGVMRKTVLVVYGITELNLLEDLDINLEDIPGLLGVVDVLQLAKELLGRGGKLPETLTSLGVPWIDGSLHCAGNDAHYTMQALLALVLKRHASNPQDIPTGAITRLHGLLRQPLPEAVDKVGGSEQDWESYCNGFFSEAPTAVS